MSFKNPVPPDAVSIGAPAHGARRRAVALAAAAFVTGAAALPALAQTSAPLPPSPESAQTAPVPDGVPANVLPITQVSAATERDPAAQGSVLGRIAPSVRDIPQTVTVVDDETMAQQGAHTIEDVLQNVPGITVQPYVLLTTAFYSRGFKLDAFEQDGVPVLMANTAAGPQDMTPYERVEIIRGSAGLFHGTGNPAGLVNLVHKRPGASPKASAAVTLGSWDRYREEVDIGGPVNAGGSLRARVAVSDERQRMYYDVGRQHATTLYGVAEADLTSTTMLRAGMQHQRTTSTPNLAGVPFSTKGDDLHLPRSTFLGSSWDTFDWTETRVFGTLEQQLGHGWAAKLSANYLDAGGDLKYGVAFGAIDSVTGAGSQLTGAAYRFDNTQTGVDVQLDGPVRWFGREHHLLFGLQRLEATSQQRSASLVPPVNGTPVDIFRWDPNRVPEPGTGPLSSVTPTRTVQNGAYAMGRIRLARPLTVVLGARVSWWDQHAPASAYRTGAKATPYAGAVFDLNEHWSLYASYADIFQPQTVLDAGNNLLKPITGESYEAGVKGQLFDAAMDVSLAVFRIRQKNRAQTDPSVPCMGTTCRYLASGEVQSQGVEMQANGRITDAWSVSAGYTFNTTKYLADATMQGQSFADFTPRHLLRVWTNYALPFDARRWSVGGGVDVQSETSATSNGIRLRQGGYAIVNLRAGYRYSPRVSAALNLNNVFDRRYYQSLSNAAWNNHYGAPRSVMLTLRADY
ncbi:TonB-dependent siderophore receptor [Pandoraea sp. CB10b_02]|uniref:TonB-dependent siderophore receptor n=1 Tax=Pandoraea sp. CB10b_02 TaxID=2014535 RepID=UPI00257D6F38|nr:TonB-dependent siderophore receptor [Pandoraea sp. CB10b_02]